MLERLDLNCIFRTAKEKGATSCEVFAEERCESTISLTGRTQDTRQRREAGISITLDSPQGKKSYKTHSLSTKSILALLEEGDAPIEKGMEVESSLTTDLLPPREASQLIHHWARKTAANLDHKIAPQFSLKEEWRHFETATSEDAILTGVEEKSALFSKYFREEQGKIRLFEMLRTRAKTAQMREEIKNTPESLLPHLTPSWHTPWPAPQGRLNIVWQPKAVSEILLVFLRLFEGDRVLQGRSFLSQLTDALPLHFTLFDLPDEGFSQFDQEGSKRVGSYILQQGMPRTLACNRDTALEFQISPRGHGRRESFLYPATMGFWSVQLKGEKEEDSILKSLEKGILIHDVEVLDFDPISGEVVMRVHDANLVHHGEEGEAIHPVLITAPIIDILSSMQVFEKNGQRQAFELVKGTQRFVTETTVPRAFSPDFFYPGTVSPSQYW